ncbi:UvrD-helicase domain-containing protein [Methanoregula sp. UBA64]|jgi:ATP-dependent helicase/nuclease subunit A|uniref:UvrD-helicase domain-containing protein n=1 Tax=Methanoregula sp. UBA64 TaxID=1915554 RepID=UPI0025CC5D5E|nr:UvrD-helicase domain-containing protein [Methanoregula sp. UBA64]
MTATGRQNDAITHHDRSMVVTAGAGTGKTYVLVRKYIDLLMSRGIAVPEILALTFTDKAAAEMKERIRKEILIHEGPQWEKAAEDFMIAPVQTFHSFCAQVLREFPIEAGLEPGFVVLDEQQVSRIHAQACEDLFHTRQEGPAHDALVRVLSITDQYTLRSILASLYERREQYAQFFAALDADETGVITVWKEETGRIRDAEIAALRGDPSFSASLKQLLGLAREYTGSEDRAAQFLAEIQPLLATLAETSDTAEFCAVALELERKRPGNIGSKKNWRGNDLDLYRKSRKDLNGILERKLSLFRLTVDPSDPVIAGSVRFLHDLSRVFSRYSALVGNGKAVLGGLDFSDLILRARHLFLSNGTLVTTHFLRRYRYILVDEFQDTDISQFDIILAVIGTPTPETDCLFIVGDPKQSIYLFRDADVTRFKAAQELIETVCRGKKIALDTSFRSTKEVVGLANILFSRLLASAEKAWEFGYEPVKISADRAGHDGSVELLLSPGGENAGETKRIEAEMLAKKIHSMVNARPLTVYAEQPDHTFVPRPARYGDIAILLEQRTNLSAYLTALENYGIPFYVHGGTGFYHRQEVYDLFGILSFLECPHDNVSLAGVLRSPYCGLSDAELFFVAQERGRTLFEKLKGYAEHDFRAAGVLKRLTSWQQYAGRTGLVALLRRILAESGVYTVYAALPEGEQILANIEKLVAMARAREESGKYAPGDFTADLRTAMDDDEREGEAPLDALAENAVNIMTVHAAKGLEFPVVCVPDMGMSFKDRYPPIMIGDNPLMVGVKVPDPAHNFEMTGSAVLLALRELQKQKERAERKRLLYVALTRARDHLVMCGTVPEEPGLSYELARSRMDWITLALGITGDAVQAGGLTLALPDGTGRIRLTITTDPATIPAEAGRAEPELVVVPEECRGKTGTWEAPCYDPGPDRLKVTPVTDLEKGQGPARAHESGEHRYLPDISRGEDRGTIIHEVLRGRDAATVLKEFGADSGESVRQCEEIREKFFSSGLMKRAKRSFAELPFVIPWEGQPVTGKIDRLAELDDGSWAVIDYKSMAVVPEDYSAIAEEYRVSMAVYCEAARRLVPGKTVAGFLYFTETGEFWPVKS